MNGLIFTGAAFLAAGVTFATRRLGLHLVFFVMDMALAHAEADS